MARRLRVFLDSDIFIRDLRFKRDEHYEINKKLIQLVQRKKILGYTSIYNLLEICGYLSFNLTLGDLRNLYVGFPGRYNLTIIFPDKLSDYILKLDIIRIFGFIEKKMSFSDSLISDTVEIYREKLNFFITWNAKHFRDKLSIEVVTPHEFLEKHKT